MYRLQWLDDAQWRDLPGMPARLDVGKQERLFQFAPVMENADESVPVAELKKLGEERVAAEVKRLNAEWDRLTMEFLPIHDQLAGLQDSKADVERANGGAKVRRVAEQNCGTQPLYTPARCGASRVVHNRFTTRRLRHSLPILARQPEAGV